MKKFVLTCLSILFTATSGSGQEAPYLLGEISFKTPVNAVSISPDGEQILVGRDDGTIEIRRADNLAPLAVFESACDNPVLDVEMTPPMDVIIAANGNLLSLFDTEGNHILNWNQHATTVWSMDIHPSGSHLVSAEMNRTFQLWDVYDGEVEMSLRAHEEPTLAVAFSNEGSWFASGSNDRTIRLWDFPSREVKKILRGISDDIYDIAFSPDDSLIAAACKDNTVRMWNIAEEKMVHLYKGHQDFVMEVEFSPDGRYLLSASADFGIKLWDVKSGESIHTYLDHEGPVLDIAFLPDGKSFISASMDQHLKKWQLHPEIFVLKYKRDRYEKMTEENPLFDPRRKGERRSDYKERREKAEKEKERIIQLLYREYLESLTP